MLNCRQRPETPISNTFWNMRAFMQTMATMGDFTFPLKPSFKLGFKPNFGLKPN